MTEAKNEGIFLRTVVESLELENKMELFSRIYYLLQAEAMRLIWECVGKNNALCYAGSQKKLLKWSFLALKSMKLNLPLIISL